MGVLEDLWYGQVCPIAQAEYRNEEYRQLARLYERNEQKLLSTLDPEQLEILLKMEELWDDMGRITECAAFSSGFRLAVQLMVASV